MDPPRLAGFVFHQPARDEGAYRANVDALHLAAFAASRGGLPGARVVDLGAGCGAVALSLLASGAGSAVLVEVDARAAALAERNVEENGFSSRARVVRTDVAALPPDLVGHASLVVSNPPYFAPGRGRAPAGAGRALARTGDVAAFVAAARRAAGWRARICVVYPTGELATLFAIHRGVGLEPKRLRLVHAAAGANARVALVESRAGKRGGLVVEPPLVEDRRRADP